MTRDPPMRPPVAAAFATFPAPARTGLLALRRAILDTAATTPGTGRIEETLRWGQPAYLTPETKSGSTLRLGRPKQGGFALYVTCSTSLIEDYRPIAPPGSRFEGTRAVLFGEGDTPRTEALRPLIRAALTYHLR